MMLRSIALKALWDQRRAFIWWALGITAIILLLVLLYPSIRDVPEFQQLIDSLPEAMRNLFLGSSVVDFLSPTGYLNSRFFAFLGPALFLVYGIGQGVSAVAGEEERGTLEVVLSAPVSRWRLVVERFAALAVGAALLAGVAFVVLWAGGAMVSMGIGAGQVAAGVPESRAADTLLRNAGAGRRRGERSAWTGHRHGHRGCGRRLPR